MPGVLVVGHTTMQDCHFSPELAKTVTSNH